MDPFSHAVIGTALSKAAGYGINFSTPENIGLVVGSIFPDIDIVLKKWGNYVYLKNHRAATHSIIGLLISSIIISIALKLLYPGSNFFGVFLCTMAGCLSHTISDILNSYGAKFLWPFYKRKMALNLIVIIDPLVILFLLGYIFGNSRTGIISILVLGLYVLLRLIYKLLIKTELKKAYTSMKISAIIPSMLAIFRWHFVLEDDKFILVGEKNILNGKINIIEKFPKLHYNKIKSALNSTLGKFFMDFTPVFHVSAESDGDIKRYTFTDLRYYFRNNFYHHGVLEIDKGNSIVKSSFKPYTMNKEHNIPELPQP
ncbi:MAG TPA: metal-dependent hydrolase [Pseudobacteroides sp.]|uniref:metal-dependent hydrolase n=1 Tax=Pseudobacteroides sp. TaxID=1968840 RepID=UPI002F94F0B9